MIKTGSGIISALFFYIEEYPMINKINQKLSDLRAQKEQLIINTHMVSGAIQFAEQQLRELLEEEQKSRVEADALVKASKTMESSMKARGSILKKRMTLKKSPKKKTNKKK